VAAYAKTHAVSDFAMVSLEVRWR